MRTVIFALVLLLFTNQSFACKKSDKEKVKQTIIKMFELVEAGKSNELAEYIVYRGNDKVRKWKDYCRYDNPEEKHQVQNLHQKIVIKYLPYKYEFVKFQTQKESEGEWLVWEMKFYTEGDDPREVYFAFLKVKGQYLLGDID